jgi:quercetin dioxygenase-like cupin family protein
MHHEVIDDDIRTTAALYAVGALSAAESRGFLEHVASGCLVCAQEMRSFENTAAAIPLGMAIASPPTRLRDRLLQRIGSKTPMHSGTPSTQVWQHWKASESRDPFFIVRAGEGNWEETAIPGISARKLSVDAKRQTTMMLVRMAPGSSYPAHRHRAAEECYVLEGDLWVGNDCLHAGDFQHAEDGSVHGTQSTRGGCLLLLVSSMSDELLGRRKL